MNSKVQKIKWVSEVQSTAGRRALLLATYPVFILYALVASIVKSALYAAACLMIAAPYSFVRGARILTYSARLRWHHAKPRGEDDWCVSAVDDYVDRLDAPKVETWFHWNTTEGKQP